MEKLTEKQIKEQHIKDARKAIVELELSNVDGKEYRIECLLEAIILIENGNSNHINVQEEEETKLEHFK